MKVFITGASGFCGTHLIRRLVREGAEIITHGPEKAAAGQWYNTPVEDLDDLTEILGYVQPNYVIHMAGIAQTEDYPLFYKVNTLYGANLLRALELSGLVNVPVLLIGTSAEYGMVSQADLPIKEDLPAQPYNHYGISKLAQTSLGLNLAAQGRSIIIARPFNIIGPGMGEHLVVQSFARQIAEMQKGIRTPVIRVGNLNSTRDFIDVHDVVEAYWRLIRMPQAYGEIINVCSGKPVAIHEILEKLIGLSGMQIKVEVDPARVKQLDVPQHYGSNEKLVKRYGIQPAIDLSETLQEILSTLNSEVSAR